jgi:hypothetical protein
MDAILAGDLGKRFTNLMFGDEAAETLNSSRVHEYQPLITCIYGRDLGVPLKA